MKTKINMHFTLVMQTLKGKLKLNRYGKKKNVAKNRPRKGQTAIILS